MTAVKGRLCFSLQSQLGLSRSLFHRCRKQLFSGPRWFSEAGLPRGCSGSEILETQGTGLLLTSLCRNLPPVCLGSSCSLLPKHSAIHGVFLPGNRLGICEPFSPKFCPQMNSEERDH